MQITRRRDDEQTISALLAFCEGNPVVTDWFPLLAFCDPVVTGGFSGSVDRWCFFAVRLDRLLNKQTNYLWFYRN